MKHLKQLKKVIHFAMLIGYMERDPFFQPKTEIVTIFDGLQILSLSDYNYFSSRKINLILKKSFLNN